MRSCEQVSKLISLSQEQKLSLPQRMELKMHLMMCKHCKNLDRNLSTIRSALRRFNDDNTNSPK